MVVPYIGADLSTWFILQWQWRCTYPDSKPALFPAYNTSIWHLSWVWFIVKSSSGQEICNYKTFFNVRVCLNQSLLCVTLPQEGGLKGCRFRWHKDKAMVVQLFQQQPREFFVEGIDPLPGVSVGCLPQHWWRTIFNSSYIFTQKNPLMNFTWTTLICSDMEHLWIFKCSKSKFPVDCSDSFHLQILL
jgi:hypothetical protein